MKSLRWEMAATLVSFLLVIPAERSAAVSTETWRVSGRDGFLAADLESLAVSSDGVVTLAPAFTPVNGLEAAYVWSLAVGKDGLVRAGTGSSGTIYEITRDQARVLNDTVALSVESMTVGPDGTVYAGTTPDATIFAIAKNGSARTFADLPEKHVWGLAFDPSGKLIAATGDKARVYRIDAAGNSTVLYEGATSHFTSLALSGNTILVGAEDDGLLYAIDPDGKVRVVMDAKEDEIKSLAVAADGTIYAAANPAVPPDGPGGGSKGDVRPTLYRIRTNGVVEPVWSAPDPTIQSIALASDGTLLAATGAADAGGLYSVDPANNAWALLGRPGPPQILSLAVTGSGDQDIWLGTGSPGRVFRGSRAGSPTGVLLSDVHDVKQVADWGVLSWETVDGAGGTVTFRTRTGNSETPDATWSKWSAALTSADGSKIESPPGRFIQWEATFHRGSNGSPGLRAVTVASLEKNLAPVVKSLDVTPATGQLARGGDSGGPQPVVQNLPGNVRAEFSVTTSGSRGPATDEEAAWVRRYRTIRWDAGDPNDDPLRYKVEYRAKGETTWRSITDDLKDPVFIWDTSQVPDGDYKVRVVASDAPQNSPADALSASRESDYFLVDNTAPVVSQLAATLEGGRVKVTARISDASGTVKRADVSIDGGDWQIVQPVDRVFDQKVEDISMSFDVKGEGEHLVVLRGIDQNGNIGLARASTR